MQTAADVQRFFSTAADALRSVLVGAIPDGAVVVFEIDGTGTWTIRNDRGAIDVVADRLEPVDCLLACSTEDFRALVEGRLNARRAFLDGRVRIEGDVGLVQRLDEAFARSRKRR